MLGQHINVQLQLLGHDVISPTRFELDLKDSVATGAFIKNLDPEVVIHAAAVVV
jgi:dTDP-4-dehydrorhamnose reductase